MIGERNLYVLQRYMDHTIYIYIYLYIFEAIYNRISDIKESDEMRERLVRFFYVFHIRVKSSIKYI